MIKGQMIKQQLFKPIKLLTVQKDVVLGYGEHSGLRACAANRCCRGMASTPSKPIEVLEPMTPQRAASVVGVVLDEKGEQDASRQLDRLLQRPGYRHHLTDACAATQEILLGHADAEERVQEGADGAAVNGVQDSPPARWLIDFDGTHPPPPPNKTSNHSFDRSPWSLRPPIFVPPGDRNLSTAQQTNMNMQSRPEPQQRRPTPPPFQLNYQLDDSRDNFVRIRTTTTTTPT